MSKPEFSITQHKGFHIGFENGWRVSVQFGPGNYGDHHGADVYDAPRTADTWASSQAEVAVFRPDGEFLGGDVWRYRDPGEVAKLLHYVSRLSADTSEEEALEIVLIALAKDAASPLAEIEIETRRS